MREIGFALLFGAPPFIEQGTFQRPDGLLFGNACVGNAVEVPHHELLLILGAQLAVLREVPAVMVLLQLERQALVVLVRHQVEDVLLQVGAGAADGVNFPLANHLGERQAEFGSAHGAGQRHEHLSAMVEVVLVSMGRLFKHRGVEMPVVVMDKFADVAHH